MNQEPRLPSSVSPLLFLLPPTGQSTLPWCPQPSLPPRPPDTHTHTLTDALVHVGVAGIEVSRRAGRQADAHLANVVPLQQDEQLGRALEAAVDLRAELTTFGAGLAPLSTDCKSGTGVRGRLWGSPPSFPGSHQGGEWVDWSFFLHDERERASQKAQARTAAPCKGALQTSQHHLSGGLAHGGADACIPMPPQVQAQQRPTLQACSFQEPPHPSPEEEKLSLKCGQRGFFFLTWRKF